MANGKNTGAFIILTILALGGLGLSGYMFVEDQFLGGNEYVPFHEHEVYTLVGAWDNLEGTGANFNVSFQDMALNLSEYFSLSTANDTFTLLQRGWYQLTILTTWISLDSLFTYQVRAYKNGVFDHGINEMNSPTTTTLTVNSIYYVYSLGNSSINILCTAVDTFGVSTNPTYNAAYLEYIVTD